MALIEKNLKGKKREGREDGGYTRILGVRKLGALLSKTHATSISLGRELEQMLWERVPYKITDFDDFIKEGSEKTNTTFVVNEKIVKDSTIWKSKKAPDFIAFKENTCYSVEMKDGDAFDTKKSAGERSAMNSHLKIIERCNIPYKSQAIICCFNVETRQQVQDAFKGKVFSLDECMTGREFCDFTGIDFDELAQKRKDDEPSNVSYFIKSLLSIPEIKDKITKRLKGQDLE